MTGVSPSSSGIYMNSPHFRVSPMLEHILTIPQYFSKHGNYTVARGKIFIEQWESMLIVFHGILKIFQEIQ